MNPTKSLIKFPDSFTKEDNCSGQLAVSSWQSAVGSWQLAVGSWQLAVCALISFCGWVYESEV